ncbi:putative mobilization protein 2 [Escherichia coli SHECO001]|nr:putative mobilization protein 2 [Escherichia coli SHECO001]
MRNMRGCWHVVRENNLRHGCVRSAWGHRHRKRQVFRKKKTLAPPLLRQFASVGNNLNQIARKINSGQWSGHDRVHVVAALMAIGRELSELRDEVRKQGERDDS